MKIRKKIELLLVLTMMLVLVTGSSAVVKAEEPASVVVTGQEDVLPGSTVTVDVSIKDNPGIMGAMLRLEYDSLLTLNEVQAGDAFSALTLTKPGKLVSGCKFVWDGQDVLPEDIKDGNILVLTFEVSEDAEAGAELPINVSFEDAVDKDLNPVDIAVTNGKICLQKEKAPVTLSYITTEKTLTAYKVGDVLNVDDLKVTAVYSDAASKVVTEFKTNVASIDMQQKGDKDLIVTYEENGIIATSVIKIQVFSTDEELPDNTGHTHSYSPDWTIDVKPTCSKAGSKSHHCIDVTCNSKSDVTTIPATGLHTYTSWTVILEPTQSLGGIQERYCTTCGKKGRSAVPATGYKKGDYIYNGNHVFIVKSVNGIVGTVIYEGILGEKKTVKIPRTVTVGEITFRVVEIGVGAFEFDRKLASVTIPEDVVKIGMGAFGECKKLKKITIKSTKLKSIGKNAIKNINKKATIKVPKSKLKKYKKLFKSKTGYKKTMKIKK